MRCFFFVVFLFFSFSAFTQVTVSAGPDQNLCRGACTSLIATVTNGDQTTAYTVQAVPYQPHSYTSGTTLAIGDDRWSLPINLGFNFCFFGQNYSQCFIGSNGLISFNASYSNGYCQWPITAAIPSTSDPVNCIMGPYHDFSGSLNYPNNMYLTYETFGTAPYRAFEISWYQIPYYPIIGTNNCAGINGTQQIIIYETTNVIQLNIANSPFCPTWNSGQSIEGIQNTAGTLAYVVPGRNAPSQWSAINDSWEFIPAGPPSYITSWFDGNTFIGNGDTLNVCPTQSADYICQVNFTKCDATTFNSSDTVRINSGGSLPAITASQDTSICNGQSLLLQSTSSVSTATFNWSPPTGLSNPSLSDPIANPVTSTQYILTVSDSFCSNHDTVNINVDSPQLTISQLQSTSCYSSCDGSASVISTGGIPPFSYSWSPGNQLTNTAASLCGGNYYASLTDSMGCVITLPVIIPQPSQLIVSAPADTSICYGNSVVLAIVSADTAAQYSWSPASGLNNDTISAPIASPAVTTTYTVTVSHGACLTSDFITITVDAPEQLNLSQFQDATCFNACNGSAGFSASGGTPPYSFNWIPGNLNGASENQLCANAYTITMTDAMGCAVNQQLTISEPSQLVLNVSALMDTIDLGQTDTLYANVSGGSGLISINWQWQNGTSAGGSIAVNPLTTTTYSVIVTDANGCQDTALITVNVNLTTAIPGSSTQESITVYPDPAQQGSEIRIQLPYNTTSGCMLTLLDLQGRLILNKPVQQNSEKVIFLSASDFQSGAYFLQLRDNSGHIMAQTRMVIY
jgi:hypothetical protein